MSRILDQGQSVSYEYHKELQKAVSSASGLFETNIRCLAHISKISKENEALKAENQCERQVLLLSMGPKSPDVRILRLPAIASTV